MIKLILIVFFIPIIAISSFAQQNIPATVAIPDSITHKQILKNEKQPELPKAALFIDVLGKSGYYALSYEYRISNLTAASLGVGMDYGFNISTTFSCLFGKGRHRLEPQVGIGYGYYKHYFGGLVFDRYRLFSDVGYRYQKKNGFLFRIFGGIGCEFSNTNFILPYLPVGLSFGYSF